MIDSTRYRAALCVLVAFVCMATTGTAQELLPEDTCIVEIAAPDDATLRIDGRTYADKRKFTFEPLKPGKYYSIKVEQLTRGRVSQTRNVLLEGGRRVKVHLETEDENRPELVLQTAHSSYATCMAISRDGTRLVTGSYDKTAIVWDVETGLQRHTLRGHARTINSLDISADGRYVLTAGWSDGMAKVWDANSGRTIRAFRFERKWVDAVCFTPNARQAWIAVNDGHKTKRTTLSLWDIETGARLRSIDLELSSVNRLNASPDGRLLFCFCNNNRLDVRAADNGRVLKSFMDSSHHYTDLAFSPDGESFVVARVKHDKVTKTSTTSLAVWDARSLQVKRQTTLEGSVTSPTYNSDIEILYTFGTRKRDDKTGYCVIEHRDPQTLELKSSVESESLIGGVEFCLPAQRRLIAKKIEGGLLHLNVVDLSSARSIRQIAIQGRQEIETAIVRPYSNQVLLESGQRLTLWDLNSTTAVYEVDVEDPVDRNLNYLSDAFFSNSGEQLITIVKIETKEVSPDRYEVIIRDAGTGRVLYRGERNYFLSDGDIAVSSDGKLMAMIERDGDKQRIDLWDLARQQRTVQIPNIRAYSVLFSPHFHELIVHEGVPNELKLRSGKTILSYDMHFGAYDIESGTRKRAFPTGSSRFYDAQESIAVRPDGRYVACEGILDPTNERKKRRAWILWDTRTGRARQTLVGHRHDSRRVAFSPNGRLFLCLSKYNNEAVIWNLDSGKVVRRFSRVESVSFNEDGRQVFTCSIDGSLKMHDLLSGDEMMTLALLDDEGNWLTATPQGLFDGTPKGRQLVTARVPGGKLVPIDRFFQDFYRPGLLQDVLKGARPVTKAKFGKSAPPRLELASKIGREVETDTVQFDVKLTEQGGGFKTPWIMHNGARILAKPQLLKKGKQKLYRFEVALIEGTNRLEVLSASADGSWESEPARLDFRRGAPLQQSAVHVVSIGVSDYAEETMNLKFAADDARSISSLFNQRGPKFYGKDKVHVTQLLDKDVTKAGIQAAIGKVAKQAQPQDTFVLFLAGHGTVIGQRYYFITHDFKNDGGKLEENIRTQGFAGDELDDAIRAVPALKRVVIYDTCHSGGVAAINRGARDPFEFRGALERMSRAQGSFTIAATAATAQAQELPALKHGVLTYALLAGLGAAKDGPLKAQQVDKSKSVVDVRDWFEFAQEKVPLMTKLFLGEEQFVGFSGQGVSFPILPAKTADTSKPEKE